MPKAKTGLSKPQGEQLPLPGEEAAEVIEVFSNNRAEVVDLKGKKEDEADTSVVDTAADEERPAVRDSADEGDARTMAREDDEGDEEPVRRRAAATDDDAQYSRNVRARINRERALRIKKDRELKEERVARQKLEDRLAGVERAQTDIATNTSVKQLQTDIAALTLKIKTAMEDGKTAEQLDFTVQLGEKQAELALLKRDLQQSRTTADREAAARKAAPAAGEEEEGTENENPKISDWVTENGHWFEKPAFIAEKAAAIAIDNQILAEIRRGKLDFEPYSDEHFEQLHDRLLSKFPELELHTAEGDLYEPPEEDDVNDRKPARGAKKPGARTPVNASTRNGRRETTEIELARQGKVNLTPADFEVMRSFQLDPNNPEHKKRFARERLRSTLAGDRS